MMRAQVGSLAASLILSFVGGALGIRLLAPDAAMAQNDVVQARVFQVVDNAGRARAELRADADGSVGLLLVPRANSGGGGTFWLAADGSLQAGFGRSNGQTALTLGTDANGNPRIALFDARGNQRASLWLDETGSGDVEFCELARGGLSCRDLNPKRI